MDRMERSEALARLPAAAVCRLAERVADGSLGEIALVTPPTVGMVMARVRDGARAEVFNAGEVLVTEARVAIADHEGWGMVMGANPDQALAIAIVDAAIEAGHAASADVERELAALAAAVEAAARAERAGLAATRVAFETF